MKVSFLNPKITSGDIKAVVDVLRSGWLVIGPKTQEFEARFAQYLGVRDAVATNSCTSSLFLTLLSCGVGPGDEVITTPLSYVSTANAICHVGATPVFVDVDPTTGLIDPAKIERAITKRTKTIIPVHLYGQMADMSEILRIAKRRKLLVIEDAAHAIEAKRDGIVPGTRSSAACYSFHVAKNITAGQGGMVATNRKAIARSVRLLRRDGVANVGAKRRMTVLGYKMQMTDFQAAMLACQLERIDRQHGERMHLWKTYAHAFASMPGVGFPKIEKGATHASHMFVVWVDPHKRDQIRARLADAGVDTSIHYDPIHLEPFYRKKFGYKKGNFPIAERLGSSTITLPLWPGMSEAQQEYVIDSIRKAIQA